MASAGELLGGHSLQELGIAGLDLCGWFGAPNWLASMLSQPLAMYEAVAPAGDASEQSPGSNCLQHRGSHLLRVLGHAAHGCRARRQAA